MATAAAIVTERGGIVECRHLVHAAVVDAAGTLLYTVGDYARVTLIRSAAKPAQAVAILGTGCLDSYHLSEQDLALMCASHSSEDYHIDRARSILNTIGASESHLRCGPHPPITKEVEQQWISRKFIPTAICNNCSGKHAGMLAGAKALGAGFDDYHLPTHPMQMQVKRVVEDFCDAERDEVQWANDGCNLPSPAMPLRLLASMYAKFANATDVTGDVASPNGTPAQRRVFNAMVAHPELVAGDGRFCTELMRAYKGELIGKIGADGCYGIGVRSSKRTRELGARGALGIAVKIEDGNIDMTYSAAAEIVQQLGIGGPEEWQQTARFHKREVRNTAGMVVGRVRHDFALAKCDAVE